jgi:hypothetical protein
MPFKLVTYVGTLEWSKGEKKPKTFIDTHELSDIGNIVSLTASGEELKMISDNFTWIPNVKGDTQDVTWRGTWAEFIYENLKNE